MRLCILVIFAVIPLGLWGQEEASSSSPGSGGVGAFSSAGFIFKSYKADRSDTTNVSNLLYDFRLGYQFADSYFLKSPCYVSFVYASEEDEVKATNYPTVGNDLKQKDTRTSLALLLGVNKGRFYSALGYVFSASWVSENDTTKIEYKKAVGIQIEVGAHFSISNKISIGPRISYRNITFSQQKTNGTTSGLSPKLTREYIDPNFVVKYEF